MLLLAVDIPSVWALMQPRGVSSQNWGGSFKRACLGVLSATPQGRVELELQVTW